MPFGNANHLFGCHVYVLHLRLRANLPAPSGCRCCTLNGNTQSPVFKLTLVSHGLPACCPATLTVGHGLR